ncbi:hypothetical protein BDZ91DRAFT_804418 [Kalaharituber pfeilii]|nr:hypothetical protein BDZ91DRAFT_804418 [Kalaharituber pfeilii]
MLPGPSDTKKVQRMLGFLLDCWEEFESSPEGLEVATSVLGDQSKTFSSPPEWKVKTSLARVFESSQVQPFWEGRYNYLLDVTEYDTAIQLRWAASPDTLVSKELLTSSVALPVVHNNYGPVITLMAGLGPIFCPKFSMELSDEDVEIFCEGMRDVEGLGVDLQIEQEEREVFGLESPAVGPSDWDQPEVEGNDYYVPSVEDIPPNFSWTFVPSGAQQAEVCCNLLFPGGCSCPACLDVKDMVGSNAQFVLEDIAGREVGSPFPFVASTVSWFTARQDTLFLAETMQKAKESIKSELFSGSFFYTRRPCKFSKEVDASIQVDLLAGPVPSKDTFYLLDKYCLALTGALQDQEMAGWIALEDPTASQPMGSSAQAVSPQIVSTPEARSPAAGSPLVANEERVDGWTTVLSAAEVLAGMKEGGEWFDRS